MSVYKHMHLSNKVMSLSALRRSCEGDISITTDDGIFVMKPRILADQGSNEPIIHVSRISPITELNEFDVGIKHDTIQKEIQQAGELNGEFMDVMFNRTLSPQIESLQPNQGFIQAEWSPPGADVVGRPVLAALSGDHRLDIVSRQGSGMSWKRIVSISELFQEVMKKQDFSPAMRGRDPQQSDEKLESLLMLKERTYLIAASAIAWSPLLSEVDTGTDFDVQPAHKKIKSEQESSGKQRYFTYIAQGSMSGHLSLWKVKLPVQSRNDISFTNLYDLYDKGVVVMEWCSLLPENPGILAVGYSDGLLKFLSTHWSESKEKLEMHAGPTVFADVDHIKIQALCWDKPNKILFIGKGPFLFALKLIFDLDKATIRISQQAHLPISAKLTINTITLTEYGVSVSATDDIIVIVKCDQSKGLKLSKVSLIKTPHDTPGPLKPWRNHGTEWSRNNIFTVISCSPGWNYCHLTFRKPLKVHFVCKKTLDEIAETITKADSTFLISDFTDCLGCIKHAYHSDKDSVPACLIRIVEDIDMWTKLNFFQLKLLRYLLKFELFHKSDETKEPILSRLTDVQNMISKRWIGMVLRKVDGELHSNKILLQKQLISLSLMCDWMTTQGDDVEKMLVKRIRSVYSEVYLETCLICGDVVTLANLNKDTCKNGHSFARCSHSLLMCQEVPYRVCEECGSLATSKVIKALPLSETFGEDTCPICDHKLLLT